MNDLWKEPEGYNKLKEAVIHICFRSDDSIPLSKLSTENLYSNIFDQRILEIMSRSLAESCRRDLQLDCTCLQNFIKQLQLIISVNFLFHFDEIGSLQFTNGTEVAMMIYRLWIIADSFRSKGHFYALTGRY